MKANQQQIISIAPLVCPTVSRWNGDLVGCGSTNLSEEDDEGLIDCGDCGLFFKREAAEEAMLACPQIIRSKNSSHICGSKDLRWDENKQLLECLCCGFIFKSDKAIRVIASHG